MSETTQNAVYALLAVGWLIVWVIALAFGRLRR